MLNAEKYKYEITKVGYDFGVSFDNTVIACSDCENCRYYGNECRHYGDSPAMPKVKWLLEEYKEPILTDKEKELIKAIIELFNENWLISIEWFETIITSKICICAREKEDRTIVETLEIPTLLFKESMFQGLEKNREYTIEELGL